MESDLWAVKDRSTILHTSLTGSTKRPEETAMPKITKSFVECLKPPADGGPVFYRDTDILRVCGTADAGVGREGPTEGRDQELRARSAGQGPVPADDGRPLPGLERRPSTREGAGVEKRDRAGRRPDDRARARVERADLQGPHRALPGGPCEGAQGVLEAGRDAHQAPF